MYRLVEWFYCVSLSIWMPCRWVIPAWHRVHTFFSDPDSCAFFFCIDGIFVQVLAITFGTGLQRFTLFESMGLCIGYGVMYRVWWKGFQTERNNFHRNVKQVVGGVHLGVLDKGWVGGLFFSPSVLQVQCQPDWSFCKKVGKRVNQFTIGVPVGFLSYFI